MPHIKTPSGIDWYYDFSGEGKILLFLHGWGVDKRIWRQQSKYFSLFYKVLTVDLPGHGQSSWQKVSLTIMAKDLAYIIEELKIDDFVIVGSSLGGMFGLKLYELCSHKIKRMVMVGSIPKFALSKDFPYGLDVGKIRKLNIQLKIAYPLIVNIFFRSLFTKEERESRRFRWLQKFRQTDQAPMRQALQEYLDILENEDLRAILEKISIPMQFINGEGDYICNQQAVSYLKQLKPQARFDNFKNCGHFPFLSKPHEFNQILQEFLKSNRQ